MSKSMEPKETSPTLHVAPSPHLAHTGMTVRRMMVDVLIALSPPLLMAVFLFHWLAVFQVLICVGSCVAAEEMFTRLRGRSASLGDLSAVVTGVILALSLPAAAPWYVGTIASVVAIGIGKMVFGGLGMNIFNPAMAGRAFVMIAFSARMAASGYVMPEAALDAISQATPLTAWQQSGEVAALLDLLAGTTNGSLGETSALACLAGGLYLCLRRTASWEIPAGVLLSGLVIGGLANLADLSSGWTVFHHLLGGSLLFGAFFIATDPVTSPLSPSGKWIYGAGIGVFVMVLRLFSGYPEGVMFAVLLMNAMTPLINRMTIPRPFGGV